MARDSKAYNAGRHVHNFFATIGHGIAVGAMAVVHTVTDFSRGVKDGGEVEKKERSPRGQPAKA